MKKIALAASLALMVGSTVVMAHGDKPGYATHATGGYVITNGAGDCWKTPNWTADYVAPECGGEAAAAAAAEPAPKYITEDVAKTYALYFDFDSTVVGRVSNIVDYINSVQMLKSVDLVGHADPLGDAGYNWNLSQRRADAVAAKLVEGGVPQSAISTSAMGENAPVANCTGSGAQLIACLRPDRRVDVTVNSTVGKVVYE